MTVKEGGTLRQVAYLNGRVPAQGRMTAEAEAIVTAAVAYVLAGDPCPQELYAALEVAVLAYMPPMMTEAMEEEE